MPTLEDIVKQANEAFGDGTVILQEMGEHMVNEVVATVPTGSSDLDNATGIGGLPLGKIVEVFGQEASGKTTLVLHVIANAQKTGMNCAIIDTEHALDKERAIAIGVDFDKLVISQPDNAEQALDLLEFLVRSGEFGVVVLDSVAMLVSKAEIEGEMTDATIGVIARLMGKAIRKIGAAANKTKTLVIFTNQIRAKIGGFGYGPQETTSGGNALKFAASLRIDMRRTKNNKVGERLVSTQHKITVRKNKLAVPMNIVSVRINENGFMP